MGLIFASLSKEWLINRAALRARTTENGRLQCGQVTFLDSTVGLVSAWPRAFLESAACDRNSGAVGLTLSRFVTRVDSKEGFLASWRSGWVALIQNACIWIFFFLLDFVISAYAEWSIFCFGLTWGWDLLKVHAPIINIAWKLYSTIFFVHPCFDPS